MSVEGSKGFIAGGEPEFKAPAKAGNPMTAFRKKLEQRVLSTRNDSLGAHHAIAQGMADEARIVAHAAVVRDLADRTPEGHDVEHMSPGGYTRTVGRFNPSQPTLNNNQFAEHTQHPIAEKVGAVVGGSLGALVPGAGETGDSEAAGAAIGSKFANKIADRMTPWADRAKSWAAKNIGQAFSNSSTGGPEPVKPPVKFVDERAQRAGTKAGTPPVKAPAKPRAKPTVKGTNKTPPTRAPRGKK